MGRIEGVAESDAIGVVKEVFDAMKRARGWEQVPLIWRVMAKNPEYLKANWERYQAIMMAGVLNAKVKEMIALTVSMVNHCSYCTDSHWFALQKMGVTEPELLEMVAVIDFFSGTNAMTSALGLQFEVPPGGDPEVRP